MRDIEYQTILDVFDGKNTSIPVGLLVDSPWMPGYSGVSMMDFYARPEVWFGCYKKIKRDFPEMIFIPDFWVEYAMTTETSGFGLRMSFSDDRLPEIHPSMTIDDANDVSALPDPNPLRDGMMPFVLNLQRYMRPRIEDMGEKVRMVCARGPMTIASFIFGVTDFILLAKTDEENFNILMEKTTRLCIDWLKAQIDAVGSCSAILVNDDVSGFFSPEDFERLCLPWFKRVFSAFPDMLRCYHNDMYTDTAARFIEEMGVQLYNPSHLFSAEHYRSLIGKNCVLFGTVPPMSLSNDTPDETYKKTCSVIDGYIKATGSHKGLMLSLGGGAPTGARGENIRALLDAARDRNAFYFDR